ncbi:MAG: PAAR domain-containing protein [Pseudomonas sp.]
MVYVIREGDLTTTDGFVISASARTTIESRKLARMGDPVWCPACQRVGFIAQGNPTYIDEFVAVAAHQQTVQCECPAGSHRLLASPGSVMADMEATISIPDDVADIARLNATRLCEAIHDGTLSEKLFSPLRLSGPSDADSPFAQHQR